MTDTILRTEYEKVKRKCNDNYKSLSAGKTILNLSTTSLKFLVKNCEQIDLISQVPDKQYFSFKAANVVTRPANKEFFLTDSKEVVRLWEKWINETISPSEFAKLTYTIALAPCLAMEIFDRQNKKGPATFFECYIGHLFAKNIGINPIKRVRLPVDNRNVLLTMDFLFNISNNDRKLHIPVKMSTRERVVQAWAHQRLLDSAYGIGKYKGIMVLFSETKLNSRSLEVVEICVPDQWLAYQSLLAHMDRIYYFDVPMRYHKLTKQFPDLITIKQFGEFFKEKDVVLHS